NKVPKAGQPDPIFVQWKTKMDNTGFRWIMLDKKNKYGLYDVLYIDSDGDGRLDDEEKLEGRQTNQYEVEFGLVPVYFEGEDGPITYHLNLRFYSYNKQSTYLYAYTGCWYEGKVMIGDKETRCVLVDYNCNGTFNDMSENFNSDRILTGPEQKTHQGYVGNFLELDGKLYRLSIAQDGAFLDIAPAPDVAYGTVTMPEAITSISAGGMNGMFKRTVENGKVTLPEGKYRISSWEIARKDDKGAKWQLKGSGFPNTHSFMVSESANASLNIGEPIISKLDTSFRNDVYSFNQGLVGKSGERISLTKVGSRAEAPKVHIRNKTGEYDRTFALEYG
ncbi:MAG: hypothetical protein KAS23_03105, partial [Anaerohalosphaera sp.]|nr:hypothetical protein [Anaerohalosphaera sp.]